MQMPHENTESRTLLNVFGVYHHAQLNADPKTKHLSAGFEDVQNKLRARMNAREKLEEAIVAAEALEDRADLELDQAVKNFEWDLLKEVEDSRKSPLFIKYFSEGLQYVIRAPLPDEVSRVERILTNLREEKAGSLKIHHLSVLESKLDDLKKAMTIVKGAVDSVSSAFALEVSARLEWRRAYKKNEADIAGIYVGNKKKVDSFFKKIVKKKGAGKSDGGTEAGK